MAQARPISFGAALPNRNVIVTMIAKHRLPAVYFQNDFVRQDRGHLLG
jgi:hypothetical protein